MNEDVVEAVRLGQELSGRARNVYEQECTELALDELVRRPDLPGEPRLLLRKALAHARTRLRRRAAICWIQPASHTIASLSLSGGEAGDQERRLAINLDDWLLRCGLPGDQKFLLRAQLCAVGTDDLARFLKLPVPRVRERLARARAAAREEWTGTYDVRG